MFLHPEHFLNLDLVRLLLNPFWANVLGPDEKYLACMNIYLSYIPIVPELYFQLSNILLEEQEVAGRMGLIRKTPSNCFTLFTAYFKDGMLSDNA